MLEVAMEITNGYDFFHPLPDALPASRGAWGR